MKEIMKQDRLRGIDFDSAFPETPSVIHEAIMKAQGDIFRYEKRRRILKNTFTAAAACLLVIAGTVVFMLRSGGDNSDLVTPPVLTPQDVTIDMEMPVFAGRTDPYYHSTASCDSAVEECVELPLITAVEFEKTACPVCAKDLSLGNDAQHGEEAASEKKTDILTSALSESSGAIDALEAFEKSGKPADHEADFFGGTAKVYEDSDGSYICVTDPTPGDEVFRYVLIGRREVPAEEYYRMNGGPGIYSDYDDEHKLLITSWEDAYEAHIYYADSVRVELLDDETGKCAWRMTAEQFESFRKDGLVMAMAPYEFQPGLSAMLDWK